jgi:hypothetical protein
MQCDEHLSLNVCFLLFLDIRELISVDDVMDDEFLKMGPNGGLVFCMEYVF